MEYCYSFQLDGMFTSPQVMLSLPLCQVFSFKSFFLFLKVQRYFWVERGSVRLKCADEEHNTVRDLGEASKPEKLVIGKLPRSSFRCAPLTQQLQATSFVKRAHVWDRGRVHTVRLNICSKRDKLRPFHLLKVSLAFSFNRHLAECCGFFTTWHATRRCRRSCMKK